MSTGRTSNSIMSTPWARAASNDARVLPGAMWWAPLWPIRRTARRRVTAGITRSRASVLTPRAPVRRAVVVPLAADPDVRRGAAARARAPRAAVDRLEARLVAVARGLLHAGADGVDDRERLLVRD